MSVSLSRLGKNAFEVLETVKELADSCVNHYMQKEHMTLLSDDGKHSIFAPIMLAPFLSVPSWNVIISHSD